MTRETRAAAVIATEAVEARVTHGLSGVAREHAQRAVRVAIETLDLLADEGWEAIAGIGPADGRPRTLGGDAVAVRTESFDPFAALGTSPV